ncbi:DNA-binding response regulator, NarL/FixJ family, contains REC and HTH domains [Amycolatopsis xylanica]|uniref:DNA-binding response regulator, NarL/FixJ family, contains REC and HTH domains n=2 Tax=Amycolatopsis xylanica TaxID=589385 RepID=A0A1H2VMZ8_9PSEU|nr:DNA-binding response regulator, NarL/FixJ family, contains REC and HTH domains [Amycolatopsis xylanica]
MLVEKSGIFRAGLSAILRLENGIVVVGEVDDPEQLAAVFEDARPDMILLGVEMIGSEAEKSVSRMLEIAPGSEIVVLGHLDDPDSLHRLMRLGIRAYLPKDVEHRYLVSVIYTSHPADHRIVVAHGPPDAIDSAGDEDTERLEAASEGALSLREREVLALVAKARTNAQIARELGITEGTVKRHLRNVFIKLRAVSRIDAVNKAVAMSLLKSAGRPAGAG